MAIDISTEEPVLLNELRKHIRVPGRAGTRTHHGTWLRWIRKGSRGVKLEGIRLGGKWATSLPAVQRFFDKLTERELDNEGTDVEQSAQRTAMESTRQQECRKSAGSD